jgi:hypothetical protein
MVPEPIKPRRGPVEVVSLDSWPNEIPSVDGSKKICEHIIGTHTDTKTTELCVQGCGERPDEPFAFCPDCGEPLIQEA